MRNGNGMKDSKLCWMYDGKRAETMRWKWDCGMDLDLDLGTGDAMDGREMAILGFPLSGRLCKVWIGRFCKSYHLSSNGREFIIGLLLKDVRNMLVCVLKLIYIRYGRGCSFPSLGAHMMKRFMVYGLSTAGGQRGTILYDLATSTKEQSRLDTPSLDPLRKYALIKVKLIS